MDVLLDKEKHDLVLINHKCPVTKSNEDVVGQRLKIRLLTYKNEYDLNTDLGVPWFQKVFVKGVSKRQIDSILQEQIMLDEAITEIISFESKLNPSTGVYTLNFKAGTNKGKYIVIDNLTLNVNGG